MRVVVWSRHRLRRTASVTRDLRSWRTSTGRVRLQMMRSPSQWPPSVLASTFLGRSWMETRSLMVSREGLDRRGRARAADDRGTACGTAACAGTTEALIAHLKLEIEKLRCEIYGTRKARLLEQMELQLEDLEAAATEDELAAENAATRTCRRWPTRLAPAQPPCDRSMR
jgi:hypothetical protein